MWRVEPTPRSTLARTRLRASSSWAAMQIWNGWVPCAPRPRTRVWSWTRTRLGRSPSYASWVPLWRNSAPSSSSSPCRPRKHFARAALLPRPPVGGRIGSRQRHLRAAPKPLRPHQRQARQDRQPDGSPRARRRATGRDGHRRGLHGADLAETFGSGRLSPFTAIGSRAADDDLRRSGSQRCGIRMPVGW